MEDAIVKAVAESKGRLCNVASIAAALGASVSDVKKNFPATSAECVVTGKLGDGFAVVLVRSADSRGTSRVDEVWSSHAYQNCIDVGVKERNEMLIELLKKRPTLPIRADAPVRASLRSEAAARLNSEKTSAQSFFTEKKTDTDKKPAASSMFAPKSATKTKSAGMPDSAESKAAVKTEKKVAVKEEPTTTKKNKGHDRTPSAGKAGRTSSSGKADPDTKSSARQPSDVDMSDETNENEDSSAKAQKTTKISPRGRRPSEKRKPSSPPKEDSEGSDGELVVSRKNKPKKRRVALESDSDDEKIPERKATSKPPTKSSDKKASPVDSARDSSKTPSSAKTSRDRGGMQEPADGKRRRRVLKEVTHTFKDEDGYLQTKITKEMVSETDSEDEESSRKAPEKAKSVTKTTPKGQASLFSFFKKQ